MRWTSCLPPRRVMLVCLVVPWVLAAAAPATGEGDDAATAVALYDRGRYDEALALLRKLDAEGRLDGSLLYRMSFCLGAARDVPGQRATLARAVEALESEVSGADSLEPAFYLANAYRNLGRRGDAREVAIAATSRIEAGERAVPEDPLEQFRLAKLYADLGRQEPAIEGYRRALEQLDSRPGDFPVYIRWARRYLGGVASSRGDFAAAAGEYLALEAAGIAEQEDWDRLAVARMRAGDFAGARDAWRKAEQANPADANRARYCWRLADMAFALGSLPDAAPDGRPFSHVPRAELEVLMKENGDRVTELRALAAAEPPTAEQREAWQREIAGIRPVFVAACLEYAARGLPLRETAFFGGYAPLIFRPGDWELPAAAAR